MHLKLDVIFLKYTNLLSICTSNLHTVFHHACTHSCMDHVLPESKQNHIELDHWHTCSRVHQTVVMAVELRPKLVRTATARACRQRHAGA